MNVLSVLLEMACKKEINKDTRIKIKDSEYTVVDCDFIDFNMYGRVSNREAMKTSYTPKINELIVKLRSDK